MFSWFRNRRRKRILAELWPNDWSNYLSRNVRLSHKLSPEEVDALRDRVKVFVAEKNWEGLEGLVVSDEIKVTIAAQACMMLLGVDDFYFDNVQSVLVFPDAFQREMSDGLNMGSHHLAGEAWQGGPIVLSWSNVLRCCRSAGNGSNIVIHEFAHALDGLDGDMGGNIMFHDRDTHEAWGRVVESGYEELVAASREGRGTLLDHYGAISRAEYFAVASETFFERPSELDKEHPELFALMVEYFKVNPTRWQ